MTHDERMRRFLDAGLYLVTSGAVSGERSTEEIVRLALAAGVRLIQLREKNLPAGDLTILARTVRELTTAADALLIINDNIDVALSVGADGVHLGQDDLPVRDARAQAPDLIVGASSHSVEEARQACVDGASYVNIGPLFPTATKEWRGEFLGWEGLERIAKVITVPFTVMGGIKKQHVSRLVAAGARTIAVVTAVTAADDPKRAAEELIEEIRRRL